MPMTWGEAKEFVLQGLLVTENPNADPSDVTNAEYTDVQMLMAARFALSELSLHTAQAADLEIVCDGTSRRFSIPRNIVGTFQATGIVTIESQGRKRMITDTIPTLNALYTSDAGSVKDIWYEWPHGMISLGFVPLEGDKLCLYYYRNWLPPSGDDSVLDIFDWMLMPFAYLTAAYAIEPQGVQTSQIAQWKRKQDSGTPEHNPLHRQNEHFIQEAYRFMQKVQPQARNRELLKK